MRSIIAADLFCGAGGTSTGLVNACRSIGRHVDLLAVNHWRVAIESHRENYPEARHICAGLESVRPEEVVPGGRLDILVASPECTHHSIARGGRPVSDQLRASAWHILRWPETLQVDNILIENVREFRDWGPVGANGRPVKSRKGEIYKAFTNALRSLGYTVEDRILNAADYGDATTRQRLFIVATKGRKPIHWPDPTHGDQGLMDDRKPYRTAREIIDWSIKGESVFGRKKPLAQATMARIAAGLKKFGGRNAEPFLMVFYGANRSRSVDRPLGTLTAKNGNGLIEPFLVQYHGNHRMKKDGDNRTHDLDEPIPTLDTSNRFALVEPFITITKGKNKARQIDESVPTLTTKPYPYLCQPRIMKHYGRGASQGMDEPLDTITTRDRFGLVEVTGRYQVDVRFRMLQPHELAAAMSLEGYQLAGTKGDRVKQIGNAVPARLAEALCRALLQGK